jgi:hypothetical protein
MRQFLLGSEASTKFTSSMSTHLAVILGLEPRITEREAHFGIQAPPKLKFVGWHSRSTP